MRTQELTSPPGRRTRATGAWGAVAETGGASSCQPARMVARDSLVASATWLIPPRSMARASTAAHGVRVYPRAGSGWQIRCDSLST
jgi:hypothetical protein